MHVRLVSESFLSEESHIIFLDYLDMFCIFNTLYIHITDIYVTVIISDSMV